MAGANATPRRSGLSQADEHSHDPISSPLTEIGINLSLSFMSLCLSDQIARMYDPANSQYDSFFSSTLSQLSSSELPPNQLPPSPSRHGLVEMTSMGPRDAEGAQERDRSSLDSPHNGLSLLLSAGVALLIYRCSQFYIALLASNTTHHLPDEPTGQAIRGCLHAAPKECALSSIFRVPSRCSGFGVVFSVENEGTLLSGL